MTDSNPSRSGLSASEVALLAERESLARLDLLATVSDLLDGVVDDYDEPLDAVAEACVIDFADLVAIEIRERDGEVRVAAFRASHRSGIEVPEGWTPVGRSLTTDRRNVLVYAESPGTEAAHRLRDQLRAQSLMVVPFNGGGAGVGWFVAAIGRPRRGFRPSAVRVASELGVRIGSVVHQVGLRREMQASTREQARTVRRLRRLAAAATNLAGAATPHAVLEIACLEACAIHEAQGALANWSKADGSTVRASIGRVDPGVAERAIEEATGGRVSRGQGWVAYPLPNTDPWEHGALVVFVDEDLSSEEEPVLSSLASLIPVAFERALGTETALQHEARLRAVVESSPVALMEITRTGLVTMANKKAQDLLGWLADPGEWALDEPTRSEVVDLSSDVLNTGSVLSRNVRIGGREVALTGARMPTVRYDRIPSALIAGVDLTDIRRAEQALIQAQRLDAMGQVAGRVAHDFNNLLTLIIGYASLLRRDLDPARRKDAIDNIEAASKRAADLTQQMLDMTHQRVDTGAIIDLVPAITELDAVLARVAGAHIDLDISCTSEVTKVRLDPSEMEQIVVNLVINSCDAMQGHGAIHIDVTHAAPDDEIRSDLGTSEPMAVLTVTDNGPGMPAEVRARCLEPFFTTKERGQGTGLGLATVYGLVRERGGYLRIDSAPGQGTAISIWLPLADQAEVTSIIEEGETWPAGRTVEGRILLVEDEDDLRAMATQALTAIGLRVDAFASAEEAQARFGTGYDHDAAVTDVILPGMSGVEMVAELRLVRPSLPVVYMTGYTGDHGIPAEQGDPVIRKPYTPDVLQLQVAEVLKGAEGHGSKR